MPVAGSEIGLRPETGPAEDKEQLIIILKHKKKKIPVCGTLVTGSEIGPRLEMGAAEGQLIII